VRRPDDRSIACLGSEWKLKSGSHSSDLVVDAEARESAESGRSLDLGDLVILLLSSTLAGLRDRLQGDGFAEASELVALTARCDAYLALGES